MTGDDARARRRRTECTVDVMAEAIGVSAIEYAAFESRGAGLPDASMALLESLFAIADQLRDWVRGAG